MKPNRLACPIHYWDIHSMHPFLLIGDVYPNIHQWQQNQQNYNLIYKEFSDARACHITYYTN